MAKETELTRKDGGNRHIELWDEGWGGVGHMVVMYQVAELKQEITT